MGHKQTSGHSPWLMLATSLFIMSLLIGTILGARIIDVGGVPISGGVVLFPLSFPILLLVFEVYGANAGRLLGLYGVLTLSLTAIAIEAVIALPISPLDPRDTRAFNNLFTAPPRTIFAVVTSFLAGMEAAFWVTRWLTLHLGGRGLWARIAAFPFVAQALTAALFFPLAYSGKLAFQEIAAAMVGRVLIALATSLALAIPLYLAIRRVRALEAPHVIVPQIPEDLRTP